MIWFLHILALIGFFPALFFTIPFHIMLNRDAKREAEQKQKQQDGVEVNTWRCNGRCNNCPKSCENKS